MSYSLAFHSPLLLVLKPIVPTYSILVSSKPLLADEMSDERLVKVNVCLIRETVLFNRLVPDPFASTLIDDSFKIGKKWWWTHTTNWRRRSSFI